MRKGVLHRTQIFCCSIVNLCWPCAICLDNLFTFAFPKVEVSCWVAHNQPTTVFRNLNRRYRYLRHINLPKTFRLLKLKVPYFDFPVLVSKYNFNLIWMQNCTIYIDSSVFYLALVTLPFKVKNLYSSIFTCCKKPLVLLLEFKCDSVSIQAIKCSFLIKIF